MFLFSMCLLFVLNAPYSILSESYFTFSYSCSFFPCTHTYTLNHINPMDFCFSPLSIVLYGMQLSFSLHTQSGWHKRAVSMDFQLFSIISRKFYETLSVFLAARNCTKMVYYSQLSKWKCMLVFFWFFANALPNMKQRKIKGSQTAESEMR